MTVYIYLPMQETRIPAEVTAVYDDTLDLKTADGFCMFGYKAEVFDPNGNAIPLADIKKSFLSGETTALQERIAALEAMMTTV